MVFVCCMCLQKDKQTIVDLHEPVVLNFAMRYLVNFGKVRQAFKLHTMVNLRATSGHVGSCLHRHAALFAPTLHPNPWQVGSCFHKHAIEA